MVDILYYLPRTRIDFDSVIGADDQSQFNQAFMLEFYIESYEGFSGDKSFMSKFGLEIRDQIFFSCSNDRFQEVVGGITGLSRPKEGDLIYFPLNSKCFSIQYVENKPEFYPLGTLPKFKLTLELFEMSSEQFNTGLDFIDTLYSKISLNVFDWAYTDENNIALTDENGNVLEVEEYVIGTIDNQSDDVQIDKEVKPFIDFSATNPFGEISTL